MRTAIALLLLGAALCGCAVVPPSAWTFDPAQPRVATAVPPQDFAAWSQRVADLRARRDEIRARISGERDVWARLREYERLHAVGMGLSLAERQLASVSPAR